MPKVLGMPLIGFIQMVIGICVVSFLVINYLRRPKKAKEGEYIIGNVHIITGDGTEKFDQYVYIKNGYIKEISDNHIQKKMFKL